MFVCVSVVGGGGIVYIRVFVSVFVGVVGLGSWVWKMWNDFVVGVSGVIVLVPWLAVVVGGGGLGCSCRVVVFWFL